MPAGEKDPGALKTIGELSRELGVAQHILRYWETRFPQLNPMQRAGNRRYYRPADADLARRIHRLLNQDGYTVRGVQKLLREKATDEPAIAEPPQAPANPEPMETSDAEASGVDVFRLIAIRNRLASFLDN